MTYLRFILCILCAALFAKFTTGSAFLPKFIISSFVLLGFGTSVTFVVKKWVLNPELLSIFKTRSLIAPLSFIIVLPFEFRFSLPVVILSSCIYFTFILGVLFFPYGEKDNKESYANRFFIFLFFFSGIASLIYQVSWQRILFQMIGVNTESVVIIVSIFMLGLGLGGLLGGVISKKFPGKLPEAFFLCEFLIGAFGFFSSYIFKVFNPIFWSVSFSIGMSLLFLLLLIPTIFMGATLPILVTYLNYYKKNTGVSFGTLYFFNTAGAALASFLCVDLLFVFLGIESSTKIAALFNLGVGLFTFVYIRLTHSSSIEIQEEDPYQEASGSSFIYYLLAFLVGFISLSQEILWVRAIGFSVAGMPQVFGHVLGFFLVGIALSSAYAKKLCEEESFPMKKVSYMLLASAVVYAFSLVLVSFVLSLTANGGLLVSYGLIMVVAFLQGGVLIALCHDLLSKKGGHVGSQLSKLYLANILGCTLGPLVTGYFILDSLSLEKAFFLFALGSVFLSLIMYKPEKEKIIASTVSLFIVGGTYFVFADKILFKLFKKSAPMAATKFDKVIQNRHGIITTHIDENGFHITSGGGGFDGKWSEGLFYDFPLDRPYIFALLHPKPRKILLIGMSVGAWGRIIQDYKHLESLDIVDINPGYFKLSSMYPGHEKLISDSRVKIHFNDARRWLKLNQNKKFDVIIMNTPHHYRSMVSNLLSKEFLELSKSKLEDNGVVFFNATNSPDGLYTGAQVFKRITPYANLFMGTDSIASLDKEERIRVLREDFVYKRAGVSDSEFEKKIEKVASKDFSDIGPILRERKDLLLITDDNMLTEYKRPHSRYSWLYWIKDFPRE